MSRFRDPPLRYLPAFLGLAEADALFDWILANCVFRQEDILMYGKRVAQPRLTCWFGRGLSASSGYAAAIESEVWRGPIAEAKKRVETECGVPFDSCLANYYRNGRDGVGWHADDEACLGKSPLIASLSLGAARSFRLRRKDDHKATASIELTGGSLLVMENGCQEEWEHCVPKRERLEAPRINLTFRKLIPSAARIESK